MKRYMKKYPHIKPLKDLNSKFDLNQSEENQKAQHFIENIGLKDIQKLREEMNEYIEIDDQLENKRSFQKSSNLYSQMLKNEKFKQRKNQNLQMNTLSQSKDRTILSKESSQKLNKNE